MKFKVLVFVLLAIGLASCAQYSTCPTYASSKPTTVKVGTYNPRKPAGIQIGKTVVGRVRY